MAAGRSFDGGNHGLRRERRAVLVVDVVESVLLLREDEIGFITRWRSIVSEVRRELLPPQDGRFIKSLGDGMLLDFPTARGAATAALGLRQSLEIANHGRGTATTLSVRMGIHVAEVVIDDIDIYGDGVNLTARLAALGGPGDIIASDAARDELVDGVELALTDLGHCYLKHYPQPLRAFRIEREGGAPGPLRREVADVRPTVAIFPLASPHSDPAASALALALADDIIAALSRRTDLRVVSRMSSQALAHAGCADAGEAARHLGASYVVAGTLSLHRADAAKATLFLCDAPGGEVLWTDHVEFSVPALFRGEDDCVTRVTHHVGRQVLRTELRRARQLPLSSLSTYTLYAAAVESLHRLRRSDFDRSSQLLERLSDLEPRSPAPHAMLAKWHLLSVAQGWSRFDADARLRVRHHLDRALDCDPDHALALSLRAHVIAQSDQDLDFALAVAEQSIAADSQETNAWLVAAGVHSYRGDGAAATLAARRAIALSPLDPARFLFDVFLAAALVVDACYEEARAAALASIRGNALHPASRRVLVIACALSGDVVGARAAARDLLELQPDFAVGHYVARYPGNQLPHAWLQRDALLEAGLPA
jgi:adenylate cyclase